VGFLVAGLGGFGLVVERAEVMGLSFVLDRGVPFVAPGVDAFEAGLAAARGLVVLVLAGRAVAQVAAAVVQAVAVDVVHDHPVGRLHDLAVHQDGAAGEGAAGVELAAAVEGVPAVAVEPFVIGGVPPRCCEAPIPYAVKGGIVKGKQRGFLASSSILDLDMAVILGGAGGADGAQESQGQADAAVGFRGLGRTPGLVCPLWCQSGGTRRWSSSNQFKMTLIWTGSDSSPTGFTMMKRWPFESKS